MKKTLIVLCAFVVLFLFVVGLCACQPAVVEDVEGTYELTTYLRKYPIENQTPKENEPTQFQDIDYLKTENVVAYLILKKNGSGIMVYSDNSTPLFVRRITISYRKDSKDESKISSLEYTDGTDYRTNHTAIKRGSHYIPGTGKEDLYVNAQSSGMSLVKNNVFTITDDFMQYVTYTKVSGATNLSYVNEKLKKTLVAPVYELQALNGLLTAMTYYNDNCSYLYYAIDLDASGKKASLYYAEKGGEDVTESDLDVSYSVNEAENKLFLTVGDKTFYTWYYGFNIPTSLSLDYDYTYEGNPSVDTFSLFHSSQSVEEYVADQKQMYDQLIAERNAQQNSVE